ncbi:YxiF family protein [Priestia megaterium]|uniref:YxiF family protein n=1 Tax=Priestia megaterium TaxID=1404 RepID=UPI000C9B77EC|nr:hypothetical protein [Priestia megaterium]PNE08711.1 hypothetical protein C1Y47_03975 [Priestia megaterium]WJD83304.1 hypothetical protein QRD24_12645 [Priestia megaterium]
MDSSRQQKMKRLLKQNHVRNERENVIALFDKYFNYKLRIEDFKSRKETNEHNRLLEEQVCYEEIFQLYNSFNSNEINKHLSGELSRSIRLSRKHLLIFHKLVGKTGAVYLDKKHLKEILNELGNAISFPKEHNVLIGHGMNNVTGNIMLDKGLTNNLCNNITDFMDNDFMYSHFYIVDPNFEFGLNIYCEEYFYSVSYWGFNQ